MAEKTLREAAEALAQIAVTEERGIDGRLYRRYYHIPELEMHDLRAALDREADRPDAEADAERGLVGGDACWVAWPDGGIEDTTYHPLANLPQFPFTDDGKRKAERAALMMSSLNFEDPPFEKGQEVWQVIDNGIVTRNWIWENDTQDNWAWHQGRIHATEAEALAWRDKFNSAWTGGKS